MECPARYRVPREVAETFHSAADVTGVVGVVSGSDVFRGTFDPKPPCLVGPPEGGHPKSADDPN